MGADAGLVGLRSGGKRAETPEPKGKLDTMSGTPWRASASAVPGERTRGRLPGSSLSPFRRSSRNRDGHFDTFALELPRPAATSLIVPPSAQASTIWHRSASAVLRRRDHPQGPAAHHL